MSFQTNSAMAQYRSVNVQGPTDAADPVELISMLMNGALDQLASARGAMQRGEIQAKGEHLSKAAMIIQSLHECVREDASPSMGANLKALYDYMHTRITEANLHGDVAILDEVSELLSGLETAWDQVPTLLAEQGAA